MTAEANKRLIARGPAGSGNAVDRDERRRGIPVWLAACLFGGMVIFLLWEEHEAHIMGALPYVFLLLCPIIHFWMHRKHGHGGH